MRDLGSGLAFVRVALWCRSIDRNSFDLLMGLSIGSQYSDDILPPGLVELQCGEDNRLSPIGSVLEIADFHNSAGFHV